MEISTVIEEQDPTWMTPIIEFVSKGTLPLEQKEARRIRRTAQRFELRNGVLYRRSFLQPWLRCVGPIQADYVLREIHAGSCSMHSGPRSVVARALRSGYYWPTMHRDARDMIRKCHDCQDYFTTWIEARAVATSREYGVNDLFGTTIVCRFGLLETIVWTMGNISCDTRSKGWWVEEIVHVHVGRNCTNNQRCQGDTPVLSCLYGTEAVIPAEIGMPTIRTAEHLQLSSYPEVTILSSTSRTLRKPLWRGLSEIPSNGNSPLKCKRTLGYHATGKDRHCSCATSVLVRSKSGWPPQRSEASSQG
ncbi:reverse transcriptase domain-containing protein [Tanacetum coccineum]